MKRIPKPVFFIVAILILLFAASSIFGVSYYDGDIEKTVFKGMDDIRWGIDIRGGVEATFKPADDVDATDAQLDSAKSIIETRMISSGITDYELYVDDGSDRIIVRFPWKEDEKNYDPVAAIDELAATANLTFRDEAGNVVMDGSSVKNARAMVNTEQGSANEYLVELNLTDEGADIFAEATKANVGKVIYIYMDETMISSPVVDEENVNGITGGKAQITGNFTSEEVNKLANQINGGALPFSLEVASYSSISPTLGQNSLTAMAYAGIIAIILIAIFMIAVYRIPGVVAVIALLGQVGLSVAAITRYFAPFDSFTMTLPGIAGIILSIGMGVDANIITAERIKDEFRTGKTLDGALEKGTKNSLTAIIDGNMTVIIVSIILLLVFGPSNILSWLFGASTTGTIYAFGYTLLMGVISNFVMGVFFSRVMLKSIAGFKCLRKEWLFGGARK
ncbi:MAG: SecD/SecF family protein translocase subunit [Ruminococcus sp.]|nr:SecD/SecF family protein translocase subunit [Ruminococcus sp.]